MNETISQTLGSTNLEGIWYYISYVPKYLTEKITQLALDNGLNINTRISSYIVLLLSLLTIYASLKIAKPIIKFALLILGILILVGLLLPF
jgi:hypothetical protein